MKHFELWLDESGDFKKDADKVKKGFNCSFVGGVLSEKGTITSNDINNLITSDYFHCCEKKDKSEQFDIFRKIAHHNCRFVVFNNTECIYTVDNNLTYQNIICEGIIKLLKSLKGAYGDIHLDILIANRVDTTSGLDMAMSVVPLDTYLKAIESRLIMTGLKNGIDENTRTVQTASARKNKKLMLADIVCNTILTRKSKGFSCEQSEYIESVYKNPEKTIEFNVFESSAEEVFYALMCQGRLGEAVTAICQCENISLVKKLMKMVKNNILEMNRSDIELQFKYIALTVEYFIKVTREYGRCIDFITNIDRYFLEILKDLGQNWSDSLYKKLHLDLTFYLFTLYTHRGDTVNSEICEKECDRILESSESDWDSILYSATYELRKISNMMNRFEFDKAEKEADKLIDKAKEMKSLLELISPHKKICLNLLAKSFGCRAQIYSEKIKTDRSYYYLAVSDSDNAIAEFDNEFDKQRQYFYRMIIEARYGNYKNALKYLYMQCNVDGDNLNELAVTAVNSGSFRLYGYLLLMSYAARAKNSLAKDMYKAITPLQDFNRQIENPSNNEHPYEVSVYALACYEAISGNKNSAIKNFDRTINACFDHNDYLQWIIGLCACCEKYGYFGDKSDFRQLKHLHRRISDCINLPDGIRAIINSLDYNNTNSGYYISFGEKYI